MMILTQVLALVSCLPLNKELSTFVCNSCAWLCGQWTCATKVIIIMIVGMIVMITMVMIPSLMVIARVMMVMFMSSDKKNESSTGLFVFTFFIFILAAVYMGYTVVFIILPGMVEDPKDYILGVTRIFTQIFIIIWAILVILFNMIKNCLCGPSSHEELA